MNEVLNVEEIFAGKVFNLGRMKERLPKSTYKEVVKVMDQGGELSLATADGRKRCYPLYTLVPAFDRYYRRKT